MSDSDETLFELYFTSRLKEGYDIEIAQKKLARVFKIPFTQVQTLINKANNYPIKIRDDISHAQALALIKSIDDCGFKCDLVPKVIAIAPEGAPIGKKSDLTPKVPKFITCPKCHHRQDLDVGVICENCHIVITKVNTKLKQSVDDDFEEDKSRQTNFKTRRKNSRRAPGSSLLSAIFTAGNINKFKIAFPILCILIFMYENAATRHILRQFSEILIHEIGHTIFFYLFGYFTIAPIDPFGISEYGGFLMGDTAQTKLFLYSFFIIFAYLIYRALPWPNLFITFIVIYLVYFFIAHSPLHRSIITFMGHGFIPITASLFIFIGLLDNDPQKDYERAAAIAIGLFFAYISFRFLIIFPINISELNTTPHDLEIICAELSISPTSLRIFYTGYTILTFSIMLTLFKFYYSWMPDLISYLRSLEKFEFNK